MLARDGYCLVKEAFDRCECDRFAHELHEVLAACSDDSISLRRANGVIYGARNLLAVYPAAITLWRKPPLMELLTAVLGAEFGLVRGLFFDKPPQGNWSLPWHQDLTIAVADHSLTSKRFHNRTLKAGVPHVEAPDEILRQMLTLRFHLDDVTDENGPLQVLPGTHFGREIMPHACNPVTILAAAGDVLAMRPLLSHASASARVGTSLHRRVIHLEFAASRALPDGYAWHQFIAGH
jgi:ectoine hydroxylase-related dioxygenase (phytanoyl-CoA dioxygenase family)